MCGNESVLNRSYGRAGSREAGVRFTNRTYYLT